MAQKAHLDGLVSYILQLSWHGKRCRQLLHRHVYVRLTGLEVAFTDLEVALAPRGRQQLAFHPLQG